MMIGVLLLCCCCDGVVVVVVVVVAGELLETYRSLRPDKSWRHSLSWANCSPFTRRLSPQPYVSMFPRPPCDLLRHTPPLFSDSGAVEEGVNILTMLKHRLIH